MTASIAAPEAPVDTERALLRARETFDTEAAAILGLARRLDDGFVRAVEIILRATEASRGRVVVTGMGKSGHIGRKVAATLASTGTPALFVHTGEAIHGDLGMIQPEDVVLVLSNSGESDELVAVLPVVRRLGASVIALTGNARSTLARHADLVLDCGVEKEACPLNLAPTASSTAQLAMGDALAVALLDARGFQPEDFARSHPGGALGRRLLTHVSDVMRTGAAIPHVAPRAPMTEAMREMSRTSFGAVAIVEDGMRLAGIFTDGDLRRQVEGGAELLRLAVRDVMQRRPRTISPGALAADAARLMEEHRITSVLVVDERGVLVGVLNSNDLMRAKVI